MYTVLLSATVMNQMENFIINAMKRTCDISLSVSLTFQKLGKQPKSCSNCQSGQFVLKSSKNKVVQVSKGPGSYWNKLGLGYLGYWNSPQSRHQHELFKTFIEPSLESVVDLSSFFGRTQYCEIGGQITAEFGMYKFELLGNLTAMRATNMLV